LYHNGNAKIATTSSGISVTGNVVISNDGNIGSVGDTDSIAIDSSGVVTFSQTPVFSSDLTISDDLNLLSDGAAIYFGADKDVFAFHVHNLGLSLKNTSTADDTPFVLTLQTGETDIAANDVLGRIQFQAPDEGTGSDAVAISAAIQAISEGDFSSSSNATALGFLTGVSGTATTKMTLSSAGNLTITGETTHNDDVNFPGANYNILWDQATSKFKFDDDAQCVFGSASGGDMRLFHSGGNSTIKNETGQFRLAGNDIRLQTQNNSEDYILCTDGAAVQIYHNDVEALSTTTSGIQVGASNTDATITTNGTGDLTFSTNSRTNSGTNKIEDGANQDITVETNGTGVILLITGGEVGIGLTSPDTALHIKETDATLTLHRVGDTNTPGIDFQSNGGNVRAKIFMDGTNGTCKEIVFQNMNGDASGNMEERFRVTLSGAKVTGNFEVTDAQVDFTALPTSDPGVAGRLWNDSNTVKVSAG
jgi:hypothetical protein